MHLVAVVDPLLLVDDTVRLLYILSELVHMKAVLNEVKVQGNRRVATLNFWLPAEFHVGHHAGSCFDQRHGRVLISQVGFVSHLNL